MARQIESPDRWQRQSELFHETLELESAERRAYLEEACATDPELRHEIEALLDAHAEEPSLLDDLAHVALDLRADFSDSTLDPESLESSTLAPGDVLADRFEIVRLLGRGGMGTVYEAHDRELDSSVAVKVLRPEIARGASAQDRFRREIHLARQVTHPNACRIFDLGLHGKTLLFLTMELLEGETLAARLKREGAWSPEAALPIVEQVVAALSEAHRVGVIHRDLKSANVMLVPDGEGVRAVVTDFGLAISKQSGEGRTEHITRTGELLGTPAYMAPEQLERGRTTKATDVYALGLLIYEMMTGELPFSGDTPISSALQRLRQKAPSPRQRVPELDRLWERTILRCLEREPEERFQSPGEVVAALKGETVPLRWTPRRKRRWALSGVTAAVLTVLAFLIGPQLFSPDSPLAAEALGFGERDWVLIAAFENRTGEDLFDGTLEAALDRELSNSRFVNVVPRQRVGNTLQLMQQPADAPMDIPLAREVALRDGGIRALLTGQIEKVGSAYVLSVELVDPGEGVTVVSLSEEAAGQEAVLPAVRRLSSRVRETLGEALPTIRKSEAELRAVSTPSLRALQLYSQADQLFLLAVQGEAGFEDEKNRTAEELLQEAITEDPTFASAHTHLAYAIKRQGRPPEEYLPHAERALELANEATAVERYFIRGSYHGFRENLEEAMTQYRALLQIEPDHYWANLNLKHYLERLGRYQEAWPYLVHASDLLPNDFGIAHGAAWHLTHSAGRLEEARVYVQRAQQLPDHLKFGEHPTAVPWLEFFRAHELWVRGDLEGVVREVNRIADTLSTRQSGDRERFASFSVNYYLDLGMLQKAENVSVFLSQRDREGYFPQYLASSKGDQGPLREYLETARPPSNAAHAGRRALVLARLGEQERAAQLLSSLPEEAAPGEAGYVQTAQGALAFYQGRFEEAVSLLEQGLTLLPGRLGPFWHDFYSAEVLALAWEALGRSEQGLQALGAASEMKARVSQGDRFYWMENQLRLAELYRKLDREADAQEIENELRRYCAYADSDFVILRELREREQNTTTVSG